MTKASESRGQRRAGGGTGPCVLVSVMTFQPPQEAAGSGRAGTGKAGGTLGDRAGVGGVMTCSFLLLHGRALLFSESRRFLAERMGLGQRGRKRSAVWL